MRLKIGSSAQNSSPVLTSALPNTHTYPDRKRFILVSAAAESYFNKLLGDGVSELRIHMGAGWRSYFTKRGTLIVVLLVGGSKRTQTKDIKRAKALAALLD